MYHESYYLTIDMSQLVINVIKINITYHTGRLGQGLFPYHCSYVLADVLHSFLPNDKKSY